MSKIIAFTGQKGSGKDTAAKLIDGAVNYKFADPLKNMLRTLLQTQGCPVDQIERYIEGDLKEEPCIWLNGRTMRHAMQTLGTEWGREMIHEDLWTECMDRRLSVTKDKNIVITDLRFQNEADIVGLYWGQVVRIKRGANDNTATHASETELNSIKVDLEINNSGSLEDLQEVLRINNLT